MQGRKTGSFCRILAGSTVELTVFERPGREFGVMILRFFRRDDVGIVPRITFTLHYSLFTIHENPPLRGVRMICGIVSTDTRGRVSLQCDRFVLRIRIGFCVSVRSAAGRFVNRPLRCASVRFPFVGDGVLDVPRVSSCVFASGVANRPRGEAFDFDPSPGEYAETKASLWEGGGFLRSKKTEGEKNVALCAQNFPCSTVELTVFAQCINRLCRNVY